MGQGFFRLGGTWFWVMWKVNRLGLGWFTSFQIGFTVAGKCVRAERVGFYATLYRF